MSSELEQQYLIEYVQLKNIIHSKLPEKEITDFMNLVIYEIMDRLKENEYEWKNEWK